MAIYYLNVQIIGRSSGRSATGAAAYRAAERIHDERTGLAYDYTRRRGDIETEILAPEGAPAWVHDRAHLWNQVEKAERRGDAQLCREIVVAFPKELDRDQQRELIRSYVREQFVSMGMAADVAIHRNPGNPHAHIMLTMREVGPGGLSPKKNRDWNKPELLEEWRAQWSAHANRALEKAGREERIDHRSLAEQGVDRLAQVHLGPHSAALERQGLRTDKGDHNRLVADHNALIVDLEKARSEKRRLAAEKAISDRFVSRVQQGWNVQHAQALKQLETQSGGAELSRKDIAKVLEDKRRELHQVSLQMQAIRDEGRRLERAASILGERRAAVDDLARLGLPLSQFARLFNKNDRREHTQAQERLLQVAEAAQKVGTVSDEELKTQRSRWNEGLARVPGLESQAADLSRVIGLAAKALEGFDQDVEREVSWLTRRRPVQSRGDDRER